VPTTSGHFTSSSEVKVKLLIDRPMGETIFAGITVQMPGIDITQLISIVVLTTKHFWY